MMKVTVLLLLVVQVFGRNPYPDHIKKKIIYNPSIPISRAGGTTVLKPNDYRFGIIVDVLIAHINSDVADEGDMLEVEKTGKVEVRVIDDDRHHFIKNIYTFEKLMCISRDGLSKVSLHGSVSLIFDEDEHYVDNYIFVNCVVHKSPKPLREKIRRNLIPNNIDDQEKNANRQRRHSLTSEMDPHSNRRINKRKF